MVIFHTSQFSLLSSPYFFLLHIFFTFSFLCFYFYFFFMYTLILCEFYEWEKEMKEYTESEREMKKKKRRRDAKRLLTDKKKTYYIEWKWKRRRNIFKKTKIQKIYIDVENIIFTSLFLSIFFLTHSSSQSQICFFIPFFLLAFRLARLWHFSLIF